MHIVIPIDASLALRTWNGNGSVSFVVQVTGLVRCGARVGTRLDCANELARGQTVCQSGPSRKLCRSSHLLRRQGKCPFSTSMRSSIRGSRA